MGKDKFPNKYSISDRLEKELVKAVACLDLKDTAEALQMGVSAVSKYAEAHVKGKTEVVFCTPDLADCIQKNPDFFKALGQEGVIEWLTPFVLGKSTTRPEKGQ